MDSESQELSFEEALARLETLVEEMEEGTVPLATLVDKYAEGTRFLRVCESRLEEAELKVQKLSRSPQGANELEDFSPEEDPL